MGHLNLRDLVFRKLLKAQLNTKNYFHKHSNICFVFFFYFAKVLARKVCQKHIQRYAAFAHFKIKGPFGIRKLLFQKGLFIFASEKKTLIIQREYIYWDALRKFFNILRNDFVLSTMNRRLIHWVASSQSFCPAIFVTKIKVYPYSYL